MTAGVTISQAHNEYRLEGTLAYLNLGTGVARIRIYNNLRVASGAAVDPEINQMLVEIPLDDPAGTVASGTLTLTSSALPLITTSGEALWARVVNGNGDFAFDCDVSDTAGTGQIKLLTTTLYAGGKAQLVAGVLG